MKKWGVSYLILLLLLAGCGGGAAGGVSVWIDIPVNPTTINQSQSVKIEGHAASPAGLTGVEIWINGTLVETLPLSAGGGELASFETNFTPTSPGEYTIQAVASSADGVTSEPDTTVIRFAEAAADLPVPPEVAPDVETPTPTPIGPTPVPPAEPVINYWADPAEIDAGGCTTIYWEVSNVNTVEFGGRSQAFTGSYEDCMCETQTYPLTVTYLDSSQETFRVTIEVSGTCEPPTPVPDTIAPNPPVLLKPVNGVELSCTSGLMLRWEAASDPSGIDAYQVQVERHAGDNNWTSVSGSPFTGIGGTEKELSVECGWYYRWRVRARDGAGNLGNWSDWFTFADLLG